MATTLRTVIEIRGTKYCIGDRIELIKMGRDPDPIPDGTQGTLEWINVTTLGWQLGVQWDTGRRLMLVKPDKFKRVEGDAENRRRAG
jgi:Domain of unknown function (DUF4314)